MVNFALKTEDGTIDMIECIKRWSVFYQKFRIEFLSGPEVFGDECLNSRTGHITSSSDFRYRAIAPP